MKCAVIFFSQTNNTEKVAGAIQSGVKNAAGHCDLISIKEANPRRLYEYDLIGLGCPIIHFVEPDNVRSFIDNMRFVGGKHVFVFSTHGTVPDYFFPSIVPRLKYRGLTVIGMADWYADCYLPMVPRPYFTGGHPDEIDLKEAEDFGREMVARSLKIFAGETGLIPPEPPAPSPLPEAISRSDEPFSFSSIMKYHGEKCAYPRCRLCMDNCPMDGIDLSLDPPVIAKPCASCMFCAKICPTGAIDDSAYVQAVEAGINEAMLEFITPKLDKAEAEGRFRRLVPLENVGRDAPICISHNKHPQWIIGKGLR